MHTTLSQAHPDYWTVTMIDFQSHKKKNLLIKKKNLPTAFQKKRKEKENNFLLS